MEYISIGVVQKPHGIKGELKVFPKTDFIEERFKIGNTVILELNGKRDTYTIQTFRMHKGSVLVKFEEVDSLNDVEFFHKAELFMEKDEMHELPEDEFYFVDLVGCDVFSDNEKLGNVVEIMETPAHAVMRVQAEDRDVLVPFVKRFVESVDLESKRIDINWMEGL